MSLKLQHLRLLDLDDVLPEGRVHRPKDKALSSQPVKGVYRYLDSM